MTGGFVSYVVSSHDTINSIAMKHKMSVPELKAINGPSIYAGKVIKVKSTQSSPPIAKNILAEQEMETEEVTIKLGDTLSNLALKLGTTVSTLKQLNKLQSNSISIGQTLVVPKQKLVETGPILIFEETKLDTSSEQKKSPTKPFVAPEVKKKLEDSSITMENKLNVKRKRPVQLYTVKSDDTISSIAQAFNMDIRRLRRINHLFNIGIYEGQVIIVYAKNENQESPPSPIFSSFTPNALSSSATNLISSFNSNLRSKIHMLLPNDLLPDSMKTRQEQLASAYSDLKKLTPLSQSNNGEVFFLQNRARKDPGFYVLPDWSNLIPGTCRVSKNRVVFKPYKDDVIVKERAEAKFNLKIRIKSIATCKLIPFSELKDATNCYESVENIGRMSYLKITLHPPSTDIKQEGTKTNEDQQEIASSPKNEALFDIDIEGDHPPSTDNTDPMNVNMSFESFKSLENDELLKINEFYFAFRTKRAEALCYQILSNLSFSNFLHNDSDVHYIDDEDTKIAVPDDDDDDEDDLVDGEYELEDELIYGPPTLLNESVLLKPNDEKLAKIRNQLPTFLKCRGWTLVFSTALHGVSMKTFYRYSKEWLSSILFVKDQFGNVFGGFASSPWVASENYTGTGESFLFKYLPEVEIYPWNDVDGTNSYFMLGKHDHIEMGATPNAGLWIGEEFSIGFSGTCKTFNNAPLSHTPDFKCMVLEVWSFDDKYIPN